MYTRCAKPLEDWVPKILQDYTSTSVELICGHSMSADRLYGFERVWRALRGFWHTKVRTGSWRWTGRGPQGRSVRWRWERRCTEGEGTAQRGPQARGAGAVRWSRTVSCATVTSSRCTAEGGERRGVINVCRPRGISLQAPARLRAPPSPTKRDDQPITFTPVGNEADLTRATRLQGSGIDRTASHVGCMPRLGSPP